MGALLLWASVNITIILCFTTLAIHFNHWWIILFAALFTYGWKRKDDDK